jgi:hypothetical protein
LREPFEGRADAVTSLHLETFAAQCVSKVRARKVREAAVEIDRLAQEQEHALLDQQGK